MKRSFVLPLALVAVAAGFVGSVIGFRIHRLAGSRPQANGRVTVVAVSRTQAVRIAERDASGWSTQPVRVVSVRVGRFDQFNRLDPSVPAAQPVWSVILSGSFPPVSCGGFLLSPGPRSC